jgi:hypothetical protein
LVITKEEIKKGMQRNKTKTKHLIVGKKKPLIVVKDSNIKIST